jgi:hypothetical protein
MNEKFHAGMNRLRAKFQIKIKSKNKSKRYSPSYDKVFYNGLKWVNSL